MTSAQHNVAFHPAEWNETIPVGGTVSIGMCGEGDMTENLDVQWGAVTPAPGPGLELEVTDLASGANPFEQVEAQYLVADTGEQLQEIERIVGQEFDVYLTQSTVVGAFMGYRTSGGYRIDVTEAVETDAAVQVFVTLRRPGPGCGASTAITSPYHVVAINKTDKPLEVLETEEVMQCGY